MTHQNNNRSIQSIKGTQEILRKANDTEDMELKNYAVRASILMILQDISISLANIADYFTDKEK